MYKSTDLIVEVEKRPCLWDLNTYKLWTYKHFAEEDIRDVQWLEVAQLLYMDWETFGFTEKNDKLSEIKRRWKNIRDYYRKETKGARGKGYIYKNLLTFLDNPPSEEAAEVICATTDIKEESKVSPLYEHTTDAIGGMDETPETLTTNESQQMTAFGKVASNKLKRKCCDADIDEDRSFLLSLLPETRNLNGRQKMDFKISVLNTLRLARYSDNYIEIKKEIIP